MGAWWLACDRTRQYSAASDGKAPRTAARRTHLAQDPRRRARRVRRARIFRQFDRRDHAARRRRARHLLHLLRFQGGGVPGAGPRHVGAGPRPCRAGVQGRDRRARWRAPGARILPRFAREQRDVYRIIDEAEFVEPAAYREHYETTATRIAARFIAARDKGEIAQDLFGRGSRNPRLGIDGRERVPGLALRGLGERRSQARRRGHQPLAAQGSGA